MKILVQPGRDFDHTNVQVAREDGSEALNTEFETLQTMLFTVKLDEPFQAVQDELNRQNRKWGEQNHPLIGYEKMQRVSEILANYRYSLENTRIDNDIMQEPGNTIGWDGILLEEVYEALTAETVDEAVTELIQVAAVALQAAASLKRNA